VCSRQPNCGNCQISNIASTYTPSLRVLYYEEETYPKTST
jgi:hypothetical protein